MRNLIQSLKELKPELRSTTLGAFSRRGVRRTEHGGTAFESSYTMKQPQDGETRSTERVADAGMLLQISPMGSVISEPEDAKLTGGTRSLMRRAMGLNFPAIKPLRKIATKKIAVKVPVAA